jgi:hypothetical protein
MEVLVVKLVGLGLLALGFVYAAVRSVLGSPVSNFGAVQIGDGYTNPQSLLPNNGECFAQLITGAQTTGTEKLGFLMPVAGTVVDVRAYLSTAPTGSSFIVDLMKNGTTMFTTSANRPTIAAGTNASSTTLPDVVSVAPGDRLRMDVIQVGSGTAGSNLYFAVTVKVANLA